MNSLTPFWKRLKRTKAKIQAVATDMNAWYLSAVMENLKDAALVFDRFHVVKLMNDKNHPDTAAVIQGELVILPFLVVLKSRGLP